MKERVSGKISILPGFGEFMSGIQVHHNKLWFAGENQNWKLADSEVHEIMETVENIRKYESERKESMEIDMILPALVKTPDTPPFSNQDFRNPDENPQ